MVARADAGIVARPFANAGVIAGGYSRTKAGVVACADAGSVARACAVALALP